METTYHWGLYGGFPKIRGTILGVSIIRMYNILGSILGSLYFGKLPYKDPVESGFWGRSCAESPHNL